MENVVGMNGGIEAGEGKVARKLMSLNDLVVSLRLSKSTIYRMMDDGQFPKPMKPSAGLARWQVAEVDEWIADVASRRHMH